MDNTLNTKNTKTVLEQGLYARAHGKLIELKPILLGRDFTSRELWEIMGIQNKPEHAAYKKAIGDVLLNLSNINKSPELVRTGKVFRFIDDSVKELAWWTPTDRKTLEIKWPWGIDDGTSFGFDDSIKVYPGDIIVLAGEGNKGKTTFALNFLIENMDNYPCTYFSSEFNDIKFKDRMSAFNWVDLMKDGRPKFEVLPKAEHYEDQVARRRNNINIIDWVKAPEKAWEIRDMFEKLGGAVDNGIVFIVQQKRSYKDVGEGGEGGVDFASVYLTLSKNRIHVEKVKSPKAYDPNYKNFGFEISGFGAKFNNIREIVKCSECKGTGNSKGLLCNSCNGTGWCNK
jgi:hypothetical protein